MTSPPERVSSVVAAKLLGKTSSGFHTLAKRRGWDATPGPGKSKLWLRGDIEAEYEARNDAPPQPGWQKAAEVRRVEKPPQTQRPCLRCGDAFMSAGAHNRLCGGCRDFSRRVVVTDATIVPPDRK